VALDPARLIGDPGWITGPALLVYVSRSTVGNWVAAGRLVRLAPGMFALPAAAGNWRVRAAAAVDRRPAVASHVTALAPWELIEHPPGPVHVTVDPLLSRRGSPGVVVHRAVDAYAERRRADGLPVTAVERAVVDTWGSAGGAHRADVRAAAINAVRRRMCRASDLAHELTRSTRLPGRAELGALVALLADGCQSELEIWGCLHVLRAPGMPAFVQHRRVAVAGETFVLDAACEESMLAVEMDGAAWHGSRQQRERDIRRDSLLATVGWQTLRYSFTRLTRTPEACRRDIRMVHAARMRLLRGDAGR
jgi:very-short-patch-repair endonuclease